MYHIPYFYVEKQGERFFFWGGGGGRGEGGAFGSFEQKKKQKTVNGPHMPIMTEIGILFIEVEYNPYPPPPKKKKPHKYQSHHKTWFQSGPIIAFWCFVSNL